MRVTKLVHSCVIAEVPDRVAIFDPGIFSAEALEAAMPGMDRLDDIFITHVHPDHCSPELIKKLLEKFPDVRITSNPEVVAALTKEGINANDQPPEGADFFDSPHEQGFHLFSTPEQRGIHYLDSFSHPGDSHSFKETKAVLALPVTAPWGSSARAVNVALEVKPKHIVPIHDWHWSDEARELMYGRFTNIFATEGITFHPLKTGEPVEINL